MIVRRFLNTSIVLASLSALGLSGCGIVAGSLNFLNSKSISGISVRATNPNGAYRAGQTITLEVSFPSEVTVTGSPTLKLATGRGGAEATYVSGNGTNKLLFTYTIQSGDNVSELDYLSVVAISEAAGTIKSQSDAALDLTLSPPGASGSIAQANDIRLDTTPPTVSAVTSITADGAYKASSTVSVIATFSEPVVVTGTPEIALNSDVNAKATYQSGSGAKGLRFDYIVGASDSSLDLDYAATGSLTAVASSIKDAAGNDAVLTLPSVGGASSLAGSKAIIIDTDLPSAPSAIDDGLGIVGTTSTPITTWTHATDATSSIATYQLAIGTTPGATDVLNWTTQTAMNTATVTGLTLTAGTTYYTSVRAVDAAGNVGFGATGDGWRAVNMLTIAPATKMLVTNERYPFAASQGYPGYTYSVLSGGGSVAGNVFTAPTSAGASVLRATDQMSSTADANITTRQFGVMPSLPPIMINAVMRVGGVQYDSLGNLYVAGIYRDYQTHWLVRKFDGTTWTTLLDEAVGVTGTMSSVLVNSSSDIWVVGSKYPATYNIWTVKHYDGTTWTDSDSFSLASFSSNALAIAKAPGGEIYVVGSADATSGSSRWIVRKYASGSWTTLDTYRRNGTSNNNIAKAVGVDSLGNVYVAGQAIGTNLDWVVRKYTVGTGTWSDVSIINASSGDSASAIAIDASDNVYVAGNLGGTTNQVRVFSGGVWSTLGDYTAPSISSEEINAIALDNTGRPYISLKGSNGATYKGYVARYSGSGTTWNLVYTQDRLDITDLTKTPSGEILLGGDYSTYENAFYGGNQWVIRRTDGTTTTDVATHVEKVIAPSRVNDIAFDSHGNIYVCGDYTKTIFGHLKTWVVRKFDGTAWTVVDEFDESPASGQSSSRSIYIDENDHVWVAGFTQVLGADKARVRMFDGTSWSTVDSYNPAGGRSYANAITGKAGKIYVVGSADGAGWTDMFIRRFDGTSWTTVYSDDGNQTKGEFTDVTIDTNGVVWAALYRYTSDWMKTELEVLKSTDGTTWTVSETRTEYEVYWPYITAGASGEVFVSFEGGIANGDWVGTIRRWNGTAWSTLDQTSDGSGHYAGARDSEGNVYFAGYEDDHLMIKKWNGYYLDKVYAPAVLSSNAYEYLDGFAISPGGQVIATGGKLVKTRGWEPLIVHLEP